MADGGATRAGVLRSVPAPAAALRLGLLVVGVALVALGAVAVATLGTPGAIPAGQAASQPDGNLTIAGRIDLVWLASSPTVTHVRLAGAQDLDFQAGGDLTPRLQAGEFVAIVGEKSGQEVAVGTIAPARDPVAESAPLLASGGFLLGALAVEQLASRGYSVRLLTPLFGRWLARLRSWRAGGDDESPPSAADNHSGALAPKS